MKIECCVCMERFSEDGRDVRATKCGHLFHAICLNEWMQQMPENLASCPQCRCRILKADLRKVYFNNVSTRNSDVFNSTFAVNMQRIQEDLCITQTNLELQLQQLTTQNETLKEAEMEWEAKDIAMQQQIATNRRRWVAQRVELETKIRTMDSNHRQWEAEKEEMKKEIETLTAKHRRLKAEKEEMKKEIEALKAASVSSKSSRPLIGIE